MQIDAVYDNGSLEFAEPVRFVRKRFRVKVEVPEQELVGGGKESMAGTSTDNYSSPRQSPVDLLLAKHPDDPWLNRLREIEERVLSLPEEDLPELTPKQLRSIEAFTLREDR